MRYTVVIVALLLSACGSSPTAPTPPPVVVAPPVVVVPPVTPPAPTITNYAGRWFGDYIVEQCSGSSGSMGDVLCSPPHGQNTFGGLFQPGVILPVTIELAQSGSVVNGTLSLGQIRGPVIGSVLSSQALILSGSAVYSDAGSGLLVTNTITNWDTGLSGGVMTGTFSINVKVNIFPGDGLVRVRLSNVRR